MLAGMETTFIDPRDEAPALRRAALLLERVRQDGIVVDSALEELGAGIASMQRAAAAGRLIHYSAIDRMEALLVRLTPPFQCRSDASVYELLRCNALAETGELLQRFRSSMAPSVKTPESPVYAALSVR